MNSFARVASLLLLSSVVTFAASPIDGSWKGQIASDGSSSEIFMSLRAEDTSLTGSVYGGGVENSIQDGTFSGNTLSFKTVQRDGENTLTVSCTGSWVDDAITFTCAADGQDSREFTMHRQVVNR